MAIFERSSASRLKHVNLKRTKNQDPAKAKEPFIVPEASEDEQLINYNAKFIAGANLRENPEFHYYGEWYSKNEIDPFGGEFHFPWLVIDKISTPFLQQVVSNIWKI